MEPLQSRHVEDLRFYSAAVRFGSALYADLLARLADDVAAGGPAWDVLAGLERTARDDAIPLRLLGGVHRLVLAGAAAQLAPHYPSAGGRPQGDATWRALRTVLEEKHDELRELVTQPVQTNEVGRSAALVGGFLLVAKATNLPLSILELGSSAGLNLRWDHFRYEARATTWGPKYSPVRLCSYNTQRVPPFEVEARVAHRRGCDRRPLDPTSDAGALTLMSFVWPDQPHRLRLLKAAIEVARRVPAPVDEADAAVWIGDQLASRGPGTAVVVFHSIFMQYLDEPARDRITTAIANEGSRAQRDAPVAWLRMEPAGDAAEVRLTIWPGGQDRVIARSGYHGDPVEWFAE